MKHNSNDNDNYKKIFIFFIMLVLLIIAIPFVFPNSNMFLMENFEYILSGVIIILGALVLFSMLNMDHSNQVKRYKRRSKIITFEG